jgi:hypothetical protein
MMSSGIREYIRYLVQNKMVLFGNHIIADLIHQIKSLLTERLIAW